MQPHAHQVRVASATWTELWADVQRLITSYAHAVLVWPLAAPPTHSLFETCEHCVECVGVCAWMDLHAAPSISTTSDSVLIDVSMTCNCMRCFRTCAGACEGCAVTQSLTAVSVRMCTCVNERRCPWPLRGDVDL
jgi:hypothetical protein